MIHNTSTSTDVDTMAKKKKSSKRSEAAKKAAATRKKNAAKKATPKKKKPLQKRLLRRKRLLQKRLLRRKKQLGGCSSDPLQNNCVKFTSDQKHLEKFRAVIVESMFPTRCILTIFVRGSNLTTMPKVISHLHAQHAINQRKQLLFFNGSNASKTTGALMDVA